MIRACGVKARTNGHQLCRRMAMDNGRCHLHGGMMLKHNSGPKTEEGKLRQTMGSWKHGLRSKEGIAEKCALREMMKSCKKFFDGF